MIEKNYEKGGAFVSEISWAILHRHVREGASQMDQLSETTLEWSQGVESTQPKVEPFGGSLGQLENWSGRKLLKNTRLPWPGGRL